MASLRWEVVKRIFLERNYKSSRQKLRKEGSDPGLVTELSTMAGKWYVLARFAAE